MKYTLRHLQVFLAVARHQSISLAAQEMSMSQSATSASLQEFESRYGIQLFDRSAKRVRLNQFGIAMRAKAEHLLNEAEKFERELLKEDEHQHLSVGASLTIGNYLAFTYVAKFTQANPKSKVDIVVGNTPEVVERVLNFEVDLGLIEAEIHHPDLETTVWMEDNMVAFCSSSYRAKYAEGGKLNDTDILSAEWILREPGSAHRQTFDRAMSGLLPELSIRAELTHNEAIKNAVKSGLGIGCLSEIAIQDEVSAGQLIPLELKRRSMNRHFYFIRRKGIAAKPVLDQWVKICKALES